MKVCIDSNVLYRWTHEPKRLSPLARSTLEENPDLEEILVSSISLWELGYKAKLGRLRLAGSVESMAERLKDAERVRLVPVDDRIWLESLRLDWKHKDPADRVIVATARLEGATLMTSDRKMRNFVPDAIG